LWIIPFVISLSIGLFLFKEIEPEKLMLSHYVATIVVAVVASLIIAFVGGVFLPEITPVVPAEAGAGQVAAQGFWQLLWRFLISAIIGLVTAWIVVRAFEWIKEFKPPR